jgi:hypothetical protein
VHARVGRVVPVVAHDPDASVRHRDREVLAGDPVHVRREAHVRLVDRVPVDGQPALGVAALDPVPRQPDHALDEVLALPRAEPGVRVAEHDDVTALERHHVGHEFVHEDTVADEEGVLHRLGGDVERPHQERLHQEGHDQRCHHDDHEVAQEPCGRPSAGLLRRGRRL